MVDIVDSKVRSRMMAGIRGKHTKPELVVRRWLHADGFRYRLHVRSLPGSPDIVLPKFKLIIFVQGCFWHQHAGCRYATTPATDSIKWQNKFATNIERDRRAISDLLALGWRVFVLWECGLTKGRGNVDLTWLSDLIRDDTPRFLDWPKQV